MAAATGLWLLSAVLGSLITISVSVVMGDALREALSGVAFRLYRQPRLGIQGKWIAWFDDESLPNDQRYPVREEIELRTFLGLVVGRRLDPPGATGDGRKWQPVRLKGHLVGGRFLVGTWNHPSSTNRAIGAFQLVLGEDGNRMDGVWIKYREREHGFVGGSWHWIRPELEDSE